MGIGTGVLFQLPSTWQNLEVFLPYAPNSGEIESWYNILNYLLLVNVTTVEVITFVPPHNLLQIPIHNALFKNSRHMYVNEHFIKSITQFLFLHLRDHKDPQALLVLLVAWETR